MHWYEVLDLARCLKESIVTKVRLPLKDGLADIRRRAEFHGRTVEEELHPVVS